MFGSTLLVRVNRRLGTGPLDLAEMASVMGVCSDGPSLVNLRSALAGLFRRMAEAVQSSGEDGLPVRSVTSECRWMLTGPPPPAPPA